MIYDSRRHKEFFDDIARDRYHIFGRRHAKTPGFYPNPFPAYPELQLSKINEGDIITIRAFFATSKDVRPRIDGGHIDLEVEFVDRDAQKVWGNILTELPATFALARGTSIELDLDEVLLVQHR